MKRPFTSRADLLRALAHDDSQLSTTMAELLGYQYESQVVSLELPAPLITREEKAQEDSPQATDLPATFQPEPVPFWRLETFAAVAAVQLPPSEEVRTPDEAAVWTRPSLLPDFVPLAQQREVLTELRKISAIRRTTKDIDVEAVVERVSQGRLLDQLPYRQHRAWGAAITVIKDRARRLTPYWQDQDYVASSLQTLYPPSGLTFARIGDGDSQPVTIWPQEQYGQPVAPVAGTIVLVLGDLGCLAHHGEHVQQMWLRFGQSLREQQIPVVALVPTTITDISPELARTWTLVSWSYATPSGAEEGPRTREHALKQLLTLLSPSVRIEPSLLRAIRGLLPAGRNDPGLEAQVWQDTAIASHHSVAASWEARAREAYLQHFAEQPKATRSEVFNCIQTWRSNVSSLVIIEELCWLDENSRKLVPWQSLVATLAAYVRDLRKAPRLSPPTVAWIARFLARSPSAMFHDPLMEQIRHDLFELVRPYVAVSEVYGWLDPAKLSTHRQEERRVTVWQVADQLVVKTLDAANTDPVVRGSPLGMIHTASGEITVTVGEPPSDKNDFWLWRRVPSWAQDWGWDDFGAWTTFHVGEVEQRMRWIPPGSFLMGSPEEEEGRFDREGPQHQVQLTRGFWLFDTPCTQALWQAVMENNPSGFKEASRPVETVSWQDCQQFMSTLSEQLLGLRLQLPTEAQWEYACRAGTTTARYDDDLDAIAWYRDNSNGETHPVKQKRPNAWGLYDMLGNVDEWCLDGLRTYTTRRQVDPLGPITTGAVRAFRGGYWRWVAQSVRSAYRVASHPGYRGGFLGFRCSSSTELQPSQAQPVRRVPQRQAEPAEAASHWPRAQLLDLNQQTQISITIPQERVFHIKTDREQLRFAQLTRPDCRWASAMGRDKYGLWAEFEVKNVRQRMRWIPPGRFLMGSSEEDREAYDFEKPQHKVHLTHGFWLFDTLCTQALWQAVMERNPSVFKGRERPVENASWEDCQKFIAKMNMLLPGIELGLPTEAEWEYACRAGTTTPRYAEDLDAIAWYRNNSRGETSEIKLNEIKLKQPNAWGLYDMLGNVFEWCHDGQRAYKEEVMVDPIGPTDLSADRAIRGGSRVSSARVVRSAFRDAYPPGTRRAYLGFRCSSSGQASRIKTEQ